VIRHFAVYDFEFVFGAADYVRHEKRLG